VICRGPLKFKAGQGSKQGTATTALDINVLSNDNDSDSAIDPANHIDPGMVFIPFGGRPDQGGTATVNADGSIHYSPRPGSAAANDSATQ
jgi:hypothetical protein